MGIGSYYAHFTDGKTECWACKLFTKVTQHIGSRVISFYCQPTSFSTSHFWSKILFTTISNHFKEQVLNNFLNCIITLLNFSNHLQIDVLPFHLKTSPTQCFFKAAFLFHSNSTPKSLMPTQQVQKYDIHSSPEWSHTTSLHASYLYSSETG